MINEQKAIEQIEERNRVENEISDLKEKYRRELRNYSLSNDETYNATKKLVTFFENMPKLFVGNTKIKLTMNDDRDKIPYHYDEIVIRPRKILIKQQYLSVPKSLSHPSLYFDIQVAQTLLSKKNTIRKHCDKDTKELFDRAFGCLKSYVKYEEMTKDESVEDMKIDFKSEKLKELTNATEFQLGYGRLADEHKKILFIQNKKFITKQFDKKVLKAKKDFEKFKEFKESFLKELSYLDFFSEL